MLRHKSVIKIPKLPKGLIRIRAHNRLDRLRDNLMMREPKEEKEIMRKHEREPERSYGSIPPRAEGGASNEARVGSQASFIRKCPRIFLLSAAAKRGRDTRQNYGLCNGVKTVLLYGGRSPLLRDYPRTSIFKVTSQLDRLHFAHYIIVFETAENGEKWSGERHLTMTFRRGNKEVLRITHIDNPAEDIKYHGF